MIILVVVHIIEFAILVGVTCVIGISFKLVLVFGCVLGIAHVVGLACVLVVVVFVGTSLEFGRCECELLLSQIRAGECVSLVIRFPYIHTAICT